MKFLIEDIFIYIHILSAIFYVGGNMLFFLFGMSIRHIYKDDSLLPGFRRLGRIFRVGSWFSIFLLLSTGTFLLIYKWGGVDLNMVIKLILFGILIPLKIIHDFYTAPKAARENPQGFYFKTTLFIARTNLFILLLIIFFSMRFVR